MTATRLRRLRGGAGAEVSAHGGGGPSAWTSLVLPCSLVPDACCLDRESGTRAKKCPPITASRPVVSSLAEGCAYTIHHIHHIHQYSSTSLHGPECCTNTSAFCCITVQLHTPRGGMIGTCMLWYTSTFRRFHSVSGSHGDHESLKFPFGGSQFSCW